MFGYRKLAAWGLIFVLVVVMTAFRIEIPDNNRQLLEWATGLFFAANAVKPALAVRAGKDD